MTAKLELKTASGGKVILDPTDTAVDRTLTLPAVAGTVFNQGNVVGTVSESGGVPTGAIIERGSNANGEYVKYADGTMICTRLDIFDGTTTTPTSYDYPASFVAVPAVAMSHGNGSVGGTQEAANIVVQRESSSWRVRTGTAGSVSAMVITLIAIGRWY